LLPDKTRCRTLADRIVKEIGPAMTETIRKRYRLLPEGNAPARWSVIVGVVCLCVPWAGGLAAIVLGVIGLIRARRTMNGQAAAIAGIILGVVNIAIWTGGWFAGSTIVHLFTKPAR
jgi:hypothetical protein